MAYLRSRPSKSQQRILLRQGFLSRRGFGGQVGGQARIESPRSPLSRKPLNHTRLVVTLAQFALTASLVFSLVACRDRYFKSPSTAMEPTIKRDERIRMIPIGREELTSIRAGDIVVFRAPDKPTDLLVKRVVAVGGDTVEIHDKRLIRNGVTEEERYVTHVDPNLYSAEAGDAGSRRDQMTRRQVKPGYLFVLGDNRDNSLDSRFWGDIPSDSVLGRVVLSQ